MRAADLERRITILRFQSLGEDELGQAIEGYVPTEVLWAAVKQESGNEFFAQAVVQSTRKVVFRLRWIQPEITVLDRVLYKAKEHNIHEVRPLGRNEGLELHTTAGS